MGLLNFVPPCYSQPCSDDHVLNCSHKGRAHKQLLLFVCWASPLTYIIKDARAFALVGCGIVTI